MNAMAKRIAPAIRQESRLLRSERVFSHTEKALTNAGESPSVPLRLAFVRAEADLARQRLLDKFGHRKGTPETYQRIEDIPENSRQSPIDRMYESGQITIEQQNAATEISIVAEAIERDVNVRGASLEARVDNSGAGRDVLVETLGRVRLELTYSYWRQHLPMPRRMILDMVLTNRPLVATARAYGVPWRKARKWLIAALDRWIDFKERIWTRVDVEEVERAYRMLGAGILLPPMAKSSKSIAEAD